MPILETMAQPDLSGAREIRLSPAQDTALQGVLLGLERGRLVVLRDASSDGKTTVLNQVHAKMGGTRVGMPEFLSRIGLRLRAGVEDAFVEVVEEALADAELVLVDDLNRARDTAENGNNPKAGPLRCRARGYSREGRPSGEEVALRDRWRTGPPDASRPHLGDRGPSGLRL